MTHALRRLQARYGEALDKEIWDRLSGSQDPVFLGMLRYPFGYVNAQLEPVEHTPGKRFRPLLCLLASEYVGGDWRNALTAGAAIELLHNFSLIHDDIEDHDPSRRHRPTVWKVWGEPQAINVGDAVFAEAFRAVMECSCDPAIALLISRRFGNVVLTLTEGQYKDMSFESRSDVTAGEYLAMIECKTAALIAFSLWCGAVLGGADDRTCELVHQFGLEMGRAFQIHDDIMGIWGAPEVTGKEAAKDLQNRKKTLPILAALERAGTNDREALNAFLSHESDDLGAVLAVLDRTGVRAWTEQEVAAHIECGRQALAAARLSVAACRDLEEITAEITGQRAASN